MGNNMKVNKIYNLPLKPMQFVIDYNNCIVLICDNKGVTTKYPYYKISQAWDKANALSKNGFTQM